jgi:hypothetical protein
MNIKNIGANVILLKTNHGNEILYSYEIPVAGFTTNGRNRYFKTSEKYSRTTTKHINKYLEGVADEHIQVLSPLDIELMFLGE